MYRSLSGERRFSFKEATPTSGLTTPRPPRFSTLARMALMRLSSSCCKTWRSRNKIAMRSSGFEWRLRRYLRLLDELKISRFLGILYPWDDACYETKYIERAIARRSLLYGRSNRPIRKFTASSRQRFKPMPIDRMFHKFQ
jgi:hypothetical protein